MVVNVGFMERGPSCEDAGVWAEVRGARLREPHPASTRGALLALRGLLGLRRGFFWKRGFARWPQSPLAGAYGWTYGDTSRVCIFHKVPGALPSPRWVPATPLQHGERGTSHLGGWPEASPPREGPLPEAFLTLCPEPRGTGQNPEFLSQALPDRRHLPQVQRLSGAPVVRAQV